MPQIKTSDLVEIEVLNIPSATGTTMVDEVIDPELAQKYLNLAAPNRHVRLGTVYQYARDMRAGNWYSSVIRFGTDGQLWDGQHRLKAVIESKTEQLFWVERNVSLEAIHSVDVGLKRTQSDILSISGEVNATTLASAIRVAAHLAGFPGTPYSTWSRTPMSVEETFAYLTKNPDIRHSVRLMSNLAKSTPFPPSTAAALHYLEMAQSRPYATEFWEQMISGAELKQDTGPFALRKIIFEDKLRPLGTRMDMNMLLAISIKAWNFWVNDSEVRQLRWLRGANEPYPALGNKPR